MSDKLSAKNRMAEMYPVKMAAGGIIGNIGILRTASLGMQPRYTPEEEEYVKQYQDYQTKYNTEYLPQYEAFLPKQEEWTNQYNQYAAQQGAWADAYNKAQNDLASGKYDIKVKNTEVGPYFNQGYYTYSQSGSNQTLRPRFLNMVFKDPEPTFNIPEPTMSFQEPQAPALPSGVENPEQFQASLAARTKQAEARAKGVAVFADPGRYNLSGFAGSSTFNEPESKAFFAKGGEVDKEETEVVLSKKELLDRLIEKQALQNLISEMSSVRVDPSLIAGTFEDKNAKGRYYDVGADISLGDKLGIGASGRGTSVKFDGGGFKENILSQLRGRYNTDDGIQYSAEYSPSAMPGQTDPTQRAYRLSRRNLADQSEISLSREPGRMGMDIPGQAPEPGTTDTTWLRYAKEFNKGGDVKKSEGPIDFIKQNVQSLGLDPSEGIYERWKENVPSHVRIAAQTILGDRTKPFKNKDFTEKELAAYVDVIKETEKRALEESPSILSDNARMLKNIEKRISLNENPQDPEYIRDLLRQKELIEKHTALTQKRLDKYKQGKGDIQYADYNVYKSDNLASTPNSKEGINLANTIGRFSYEKTPTGEIIIKDRWDFDNELDQGYASKYEKLSPVPRAVELTKDLFKPGMDAKTALTLSAMATLGKSKGRDIDLKISAGNSKAANFIKSKK